MDLVFPYKHFSNSILNNVTFLIDLFTKLYLAGINFKVSADKEEFAFISSKKPMRMACYFYMSPKFLIDINSRFERILTKDGKPIALFKIIKELIKDPNKDYVLYNHSMYLILFNFIKYYSEKEGRFN